jgi:hypothetical protein
VTRLYEVLIDYSKCPKASVLRVVVITKGEAVIGVEPAEIEMAALLSFANCDHGNSFGSVRFKQFRV